jgi:AraC-like DNA-binding protein
MGPFRGELTEVQAGPIIANSGCYSRTLRAVGCLPDDNVVVGAVLAAERDGCLNGYRFGARDLVCYPAGAELDYLLPARTRWAALQLPRTMLAAELGMPEELFLEPRVFPASLPGCARVVRRLERLLGIEDGCAADVVMQLAQDLAGDLVPMAELDAAGCTRPNYAERMQQLRCFERLVRERIGEDLRIPSLCDAIGVAQRTLEQTFQDHVGVSPRRYLTILRLHAAREALLRGIDVHIGSVAANCGLHHPGRFANDYRMLFGEPPSATARA